MKKITSNVACFVSGVIIASAVGALAATYTATENAFPIKINGQDTQMEGYNINGSTYFKLRDIGDRMGFNVDFQDNTIYIGEVPNTNVNTNIEQDIVYYSAPYAWCPDFGACTDAELNEQLSDNSYMYNANDNDVETYFDILSGLGFQKGYIGGDTEWISFVKGDCFISMNYYGGYVGMLIGRGDWVQDQFTPAN